MVNKVHFSGVVVMYDLFLDKKARLFFNLYRQLQRENRQSLEGIAKKLAISQWSVMRLIRQFQSMGLHLRLGIDILRQEGCLYLLTLEDFDERQLFFSLMERSLVLQLLQLLWQHPSFTVADLAKAVFQSPTTIRRALREIQPLLAQYQLDIKLGQPPLIRGSEAEIRFFYLHLQFLTAGVEFQLNQQKILEEWQKAAIRRDRQGLRVKEDWFDRNQVQGMLSLPEYRFSGKGFDFLWQQLSGLETIWIPSLLEELLPKEWLRNQKDGGKEIYLEFYRLHLLAWLFSGNLALSLAPLPDRPQGNQLLEKLFHQHLPGYQQLLDKHPELPYCHELIFSKYQQQTQVHWLSFPLIE